jgi:uncharacterized membrane protein
MNTLHVIAIAFAIAGGLTSLSAYIFERRATGDELTAKTVKIIYLSSYVMMSLSVFFVSLQGLLR